MENEKTIKLKTEIELRAIVGEYQKHPTNENLYPEADLALRELFRRKKYLPEKVISKLMYYAYSEGHSAGMYEVIIIACNLLDCFNEET